MTLLSFDSWRVADSWIEWYPKPNRLDNQVAYSILHHSKLVEKREKKKIT